MLSEEGSKLNQMLSVRWGRGDLWIITGFDYRRLSEAYGAPPSGDGFNIEVACPCMSSWTQTEKNVVHVTQPFIFCPLLWSQSIRACITNELRDMENYQYMQRKSGGSTLNSLYIYVHMYFKTLVLNLHWCIWQMLLSKVICIAFKVYICSVLAFTRNRNHELFEPGLL